MKKTEIFITGATGFLGQELLKGLIEKASKIYLLIRGHNKFTAEERFEKVLRNTAIANKVDLTVLQQKCFLIEGNLNDHQFGLSDSAFNDLACTIEVVFHSAASVQLIAPLEMLRRTNVNGTKTIIDLARLANQKGHFKRLNYISTAYVAGKRQGIIYEKELTENQIFNNNYEQAKFEAELLVEEAKKDLPICIYRPSMVMGHSQTGWTSAFNVLYGPIKMGYFGNLPIVPGCKRSKIDAVPINYVADSILHLSSLEEVTGKTFHITVGVGRSISATEILELSYEYLSQLVNDYGLKNPMRKPAMIHPKVFKAISKNLYHTALGERRNKMKKLLTYVNYTLYYKEFDNSEAKKYLEPAGIIAPKLQDYLDVICKYAVDHHFGKANGPRDVYPKKWLGKRVGKEELVGKTQHRKVNQIEIS